MVMTCQWKDAKPSDRAWRPKAGMSRNDSAAEQDRAAGGANRRRIVLPGGRVAMASICLRLPPKSRRVYAYLRWYDGSRTQERYVCQVDGPTRRENLLNAWRAVDASGLTGSSLGDLPETSESASWATSPAVRSVMRANKGRDTRPELALRSAVHARGMRYRVNIRPVPNVRRTADLVFPGRRVAVFLDGCFWHGCPEHYRPASKNSEFWTSKVADTRRRDADTDERLAAEGWTVIRIWEHEDPAHGADRVCAAVRDSNNDDSAHVDS